MQINPGKAVHRLFPLVDPTTGERSDADALPTAVLYRNGVAIGIDPNVAGGVAVTIAGISTGLYRASYTVPATYVAGDVVQVVVTATVAGLENVLTLEADGVEDPVPSPATQIVQGPLALSAVNPALDTSGKAFTGELYAFEFELRGDSGNPSTLGTQTATALLTDTSGASVTPTPTATVVYADGGRVRVTGTAPSTAGEYRLTIEMSDGDVYDGFRLFARSR